MRSEYIRATHPAGPPIPEIPILGTSWYRRGVSYFVRRAGVSLVMLIILSLFALFVGAIVDGIVTSLQGAARVLLLALAGATVVASVIAAARQRREPASTSLPRSAAVRGAGLGVSARIGSPIGGAILFVVSLIGIGWPLLWLVLSFRRHLGPAEVAAVQGVAQWKAQHPEWRP